MKLLPRQSAWLQKAQAVAELLRLIVWTPSETVVDAEQVQWVHVKLAGAKALTVWPEHASLLAETVSEALRYVDGSGEHAVDLPAGVLQVRENTVTLFLAGTLGEQSWPEGEEERFDRLAETMLAGRAPSTRSGQA
jgi:F0F1-type ATP synthase epsilon subunit